MFSYCKFFLYDLAFVGLQEVGIFRLPGSTVRVNELKELFNSGTVHSFTSVSPLDYKSSISMPLVFF